MISEEDDLPEKRMSRVYKCLCPNKLSRQEDGKWTRFLIFSEHH
jgi:hypothetical protein